MTLEQLAEAGEAAVKVIDQEQNTNAAFFQIVVTPNVDGHSTTVSIAGAAHLISDALETLLRDEKELRVVVAAALKKAECDCPACQVRRALAADDDDASSKLANLKRIVNDPNIN